MHTRKKKRKKERKKEKACTSSDGSSIDKVKIGKREGGIFDLDKHLPWTLYRVKNDK